MEKTKLGISVCLMGALVFLAGYAGFTVMALVAGYVLLREENAKLRKYAAYAITFFIGFILVNLCIDAVSNVFSIINIRGWMYSVDVISTIYSVINTILSTLSMIVSLAEKLLFGLFAVCAFMNKDVKLAPLDKFLEKHF